jgi:hypothetical protein
MDDTRTGTPYSSPYSPKVCINMLDTMGSPKLPNECEQFQDVMLALQRKNSDRSAQAIAFEGMHAGEAAAAMAARDRGKLSPAQIQRRMTSNSKRHMW